jgi:threonine aldolase
MLAKGRLLGLQFDTLFTDGLYYRISAHAVGLAKKIRTAFEEKNIPLYFDSPTNQQFPMLTDEQMKALGEEFAYSYWCKAGDKHAVRFCTSWATKEDDVDKLIEAIKKL